MCTGVCEPVCPPHIFRLILTFSLSCSGPHSKVILHSTLVTRRTQWQWVGNGLVLTRTLLLSWATHTRMVRSRFVVNAI